MPSIIPLEDVERIREQLKRAQTLASERFRDAFARQSDLPPNERWLAHLELQAAALLETSRDVSATGRIQYDVIGRTVIPYVVRGEPLFPHLQIARTPAALFEHWMIVSELHASSAWATTRIIATAAEYDEALRRMQQPQLVRALVASFLPEAEWRGDHAMLEVTLHARATEERIERRVLTLDARREWSFHARELLAEGRGGISL
jgi:hypothetical protein